MFIAALFALFAGAKQNTNPEHKMEAYSSGTDEVEYGWYYGVSAAQKSGYEHC